MASVTASQVNDVIQEERTLEDINTFNTENDKQERKKQLPGKSKLRMNIDIQDASSSSS